jgi:hypothetical protein
MSWILALLPFPYNNEIDEWLEEKISEALHVNENVYKIIVVHNTAFL